MTLSKKGSRKIVVGDEEYRWTITATTKGQIVLIVEHGTEKGQRIEVQIQSDINEIWVEFPHVDDLNLKVVKPKEVVIIILEANEQGWRPRKKGSPLGFDWDNSSLNSRHKK